jgi:hypothetical protein
MAVRRFAFGGLVLFAVSIALAEWWSTGRPGTLALKTLAAAAISVALLAFLPWKRWVASSDPRGPWFRAALFLLALHHFYRILTEEALRLMRARSLCVRRETGPMALASLAAAVGDLIRRTLNRAERFYAALVLEGLEG